MQSKFNEMMAKNERVERELNTKRKILSDYDEIKKGEIDLLVWKSDMQRSRITILEMQVEDIMGEAIRLKDKYMDGLQKIEALETSLFKEKAQVKSMSAELKETNKDKHEMQTNIDDLHSQVTVF